VEKYGTFRFSVQGNMVTNADIQDDASDGFKEDEAPLGTKWELADRLMQSLEWGEGAGEGDLRCESQGIAGDSAHLIVVEKDGTVRVDLVAHKTCPSSQDCESAVVALRAQYDDCVSGDGDCVRE
jgi:uncharacterized Ntn-hydrolase superfamily protein